jgi:hypothetical protein
VLSSAIGQLESTAERERQRKRERERERERQLPCLERHEDAVDAAGEEAVAVEGPEAEA